MNKYVMLALATLVAGCGQVHQTPQNLDANHHNIVGGEEITDDADPIAASTVLLVMAYPKGQLDGTPATEPQAEPQNNEPQGEPQGKKPELQFAICTGSLLSDQTVLTAAHCVDHNPVAVAVVFGRDINKKEELVVRKNATYRMHPRWKSKGSSQVDLGDVALVKFEGGLPPGFRAAQFLKQETLLKAGQKIAIAGYGVANPTASAPEDAGDGLLRRADVAIIDSTFATTEVITDESQGSGVCFGDSGGPAFVVVGGQPFLWGVASRVSAKECNGLSVHTNALKYQGWIRQTAASM